MESDLCLACELRSHCKWRKAFNVTKCDKNIDEPQITHTTENDN